MTSTAKQDFISEMGEMIYHESCLIPGTRALIHGFFGRAVDVASTPATLTLPRQNAHMGGIRHHGYDRHQGKEIAMKRCLTTIILLVSVLMIPCAMAEDRKQADSLKLWGKQTAGSGHMKNAKTEGNTLVLDASAKIVSVEANCSAYSIWSVVTPKNRHAKAVLSGGKGKKDLVGKTLPAGSYRVIPGVDRKTPVATVTIILKQ